MTTSCTVCDTSLPASSRYCPSCGTPVPGPGGTTAVVDPANEQLLRLRRVLAGRFEVLEELGRGGMASVYRARQISLDRELAIKVLNAGLNQDSDLVQRFIREARTQGRLEHPGIIPVYEVYQEAGLSFYTMPRIQGPSLRLFLKENPKPDIPIVRRLLREACDALGYAHGQGLIHRDVKPENMLMDSQRGRLILTDFGIAKTLSSVTMLTMTGEQLGTPRYMAPDQGDTKRPLDGRSDQYSLGLVAYEMVTGHMAFQADNLAELMYKHRYEEPEPLAAHRPDAPAGLVAAILRAISKNREDRFTTMEEFGAALSHDEAPAGAPIVAPPSPAVASAATVVPPAPSAGLPIVLTPSAVPSVAVPPAAPSPTVLAPAKRWRDRLRGSGPIPPFLNPAKPRRGIRWRWIFAVLGVIFVWNMVTRPARERRQRLNVAQEDATQAELETPTGATPTGAPAAGTNTPDAPPPVDIEKNIAIVPTPALPGQSEDWVKAMRSFKGIEGQMDSVLGVVMPGEAMRLGRIRVRAESLAGAGDLPRALGLLGQATGDMRRSGRRAIQLRVTVNLAEGAAARARAGAERTGAAERNAEGLSDADDLVTEARELRDEGKYVESEQHFRAATEAFLALSAKSEATPELPAPPVENVPSLPPPAPPAGMTEQIGEQLDRFGTALASEDIGRIRSEFPDLALGPNNIEMFKAIFDRADELSVTRVPARVVGDGAGRVADVAYELSFRQARTKQPAHQQLRLRFSFAESDGVWRMKAVARRGY